MLIEILVKGSIKFIVNLKTINMVAFNKDEIVFMYPDRVLVKAPRELNTDLESLLKSKLCA